MGEQRYRTTSDIEVEPLYDESSLDGWEPAKQLGRPGVFPYTRGVQPSMYRGRLWTMRQYAGFANASETDRRFKYLLAQGQTGLSVAFDLPTQMGYDPDAPAAMGEVGRVGVPISSIEDMETLLADLPLGEMTTSMTINATAAILLAFYVAVADARGIPRDRLGGTIQNDILKEYVARGTYIYPVEASMRLVTIFEFCARELPRWNTISISGYHMREAGATAAQELAFTLADGIAYVEGARSRGLDVDEFAGRLSFFFAAWSELFEEVAKFRAARRMWARIMRDRFGAREARSMMCRFHVQTAGVEADRAVGRQQRRAHDHRGPRRGPRRRPVPPHQRARRSAGTADRGGRSTALRTQQVIAYESGVTATPDPLAGSYFVERLTDQLEAAANDYLREIDALGGAIKAIEAGYPQRQIQEAAYHSQRRIEAGEQVVVGVNRFTDDEPHTPELQRIDPQGERDQVARVQRVRTERDAAAWEASLQRLGETARGDGNLVPGIIDAVKARATLGEISDALRVAFGEHRELITV